MKKQKVGVPFFFKKISHQDTVNELNDDYPINLKYNEELIDRICQRYYLIDKAHIGHIVKTIFQSFRELLILQKVLNFNNLFFDTKLFFFQHRRGGHILPSLKVKMTTPPKLRKL